VTPRRLWVGIGRLVFRVRDALLPVGLIVLLATTHSRWPGGRREWDLALNVLGLELAIAGQALRALVIGLAYIRRGGKDRRVYADDLVVDGIFAHCRNPLYVGNLTSLFGVLVIHNSPVAYLVGIPFFTLAYWSIVSAEEEFLTARFGDAYRKYCARVPRFLFSTRGLGATLAAFDYDWRRLVRKEYGTTLTGATAVLGTLLWDDYQHLGRAGVAAALPWMTVVWVQLAAAYLVARWLKKSGRLGTDRS
jgi:protein-S-isoprenylcysteine O-methyltransferase Ste14